MPAQVQADGSLQIAFEIGAMHETAPIAWQEIEGQRIPVEVAFTALSATEIGFAPGVYNPAQPLFIDPTLTWNTFLGGSDSDDGNAIAVDASENVYVAGRSFATWGTPVNPHAGNHDAFAAKLDSSGVRQWHTFLGGSGDDRGQAIAVDASGNVYVAGISLVTWGTPVNSHAGSSDAFAAQLTGSGGLVWNTFLGGSGNDSGSAIAVDASGNVYVAGQSAATWGTPVNPHAGGTNDAFAAKLDSSGVQQWHTFLGGSGLDSGSDISVDASGNVYVVGTSLATWGTPIIPHAGGDDAFAAKLTSSGGLVWNTFLGGNSFDIGNTIAVDTSGNVYVAGYSFAAWGTPVNPYAGSRDAFVARLTSNGVRQWHTFLGGSGDDFGNAIAVDASGNVYMAGTSLVTWGTPVNPFAGGQDAFAAKISDVIPSTPTPTNIPTPTDTPTNTPTTTPTETPTPTDSPTNTPTPTDTPTPNPTDTPIPTNTPTNTPTSTPAVWSSNSSGTTQSLYGVACPTTTLCKAVGDGGTIVSWNGTTWSADNSGTSRTLRGVACVTATLCKAVGDGGTIVSWNGTTWSADSSGTTTRLNGVACATVTRCKAVSGSGTIRSWSGTTWSTNTSGTTEQLLAVACPAATLCKAVGGSGTIVSWNGTTWSADTSGTTQFLRGVTCSTATRCKAVGGSGTIVSWNGTTWSADASGTTTVLRGVACSTTTLCKAVGNAGNIRSWNGTTWSADSSGTTATLNGVACPAATLCKAVGDGGTIRSWN